MTLVKKLKRGEAFGETALVCGNPFSTIVISSSARLKRSNLLVDHLNAKEIVCAK
jgi:hypothetical protein